LSGVQAEKVNQAALILACCITPGFGHLPRPCLVPAGCRALILGKLGRPGELSHKGGNHHDDAAHEIGDDREHKRAEKE